MQIALGRLELEERRIADLNMRLAAVRDAILRETVQVPPELKAEQTMLQQQIAIEESRWSDVNRRLDELEKSVGNL